MKRKAIAKPSIFGRPDLLGKFLSIFSLEESAGPLRKSGVDKAREPYILLCRNISTFVTLQLLLLFVVEISGNAWSTVVIGGVLSMDTYY